MSIATLIRKIIPERMRPIRYLEQNARAGTHGAVRVGPFAGMKYIDQAFGSCYIPKLLGIYERELNPAIEKICAMKPGVIVDIGAAEGYYAVGLSIRNPQSKVIAFEMEEKGRAVLKGMIERNNRQAFVEIRGKCEPADLINAISSITGPIVIICDCEGYEKLLLDPQAVPQLQRAYILVEMHDFIEAGVTELLTERFAPTHAVERIWQTDRAGSEYPFRSLYISLLPSSYKDWAVGEWRPVRMSWLWMQPKNA